MNNSPLFPTLRKEIVKEAHVRGLYVRKTAL